MHNSITGVASGPDELYIGLMSGTSTDGVDAALAQFRPGALPELLGEVSLPMPESLRSQLLDLNEPGLNELERAALASNQLAQLYGQAVHALLAETGTRRQQVRAIGAHGQTVRHAPGQGYTVQLNAPALLAEITGIAVIADFRSRDVAAGGQGAPLVPAFHQALFGSGHHRAVLNLGGIANITVLEPNGAVRGFDTGPANMLLDTWAQQNIGQAYDCDGAWASGGQVNAALLEHLIDSEPWFRQPPPKSTGRDLFNHAWLLKRLESYHAMQGHAVASPRDVQATLQALTARTVAQALRTWAEQTREVLVCGGGALNKSLMRELRSTLHCPVEPTSSAGVPVMAVEAMAFAWLAWAHENGHHAGLPAVTGARAARILGCRYPA